MDKPHYCAADDVAIAQTPRIGISAVPVNYADTEEEWAKVLERASEFGAEVVQLPAGFWHENQLGPGRYTWSDQTPWYRLIKAEKSRYAFRVSKDFAGPFFQKEITSPPDLRDREFMDATFLGRYLEMVDAYLDSCGDVTDHLLIHAEGAYEYFDANANQATDYARFLNAVRQHVHARSPHVKVAINIDPQTSDKLLRQFADSLDFVAFDMMRSEGIVEQPGDFRELVNRLIAAVGGKRISVAFYWSTARADGGSDASQLAAFRTAMQVVDEQRDHFEYAVFGSVFDDDPKVLGPVFKSTFSGIPDAFMAKIVDSQASQGMIRLDGSAKPAWDALKGDVAAFKVRRPQK